MGAFEEGFLFNELSEAKQNILRSINNLFPEESAKFLKDEAKKLLKLVKKTAKKEVGTSKNSKTDWDESKSYHKRFKVGKKYKYDNDDCIRVYNSARHAHLIEYGHRNVSRSDNNKVSGFTLGKLIFDISALDFEPEFRNDCETFMTQFVDDTIRGKF